MPTTRLAPPYPATAAFAASRFGAPAGQAGFAPGTRLDTPAGPVAVEMLRPGDRLCTADGGTVALHRLDPPPDLDPGHAAPLHPAILIPRGACHGGLPRQDLLLGPHQAVWLDGHPLAAAGLLAGPAVRRAGPVALVRVIADRPAVVLAEGLACALGPPVRPEADVHAGAALARARLHLAGPAAAGQPGAGAVDMAPDGTLNGWALDPAGADTPVLLEVLLDDLTIGFALADQPRPDLAVAGLGDGRCGFGFRLPPCEPGQEHLLRLHMVGSGAAVPGTPLLLAAIAPAAAVLGAADDVLTLARGLDALAQGYGRAAGRTVADAPAGAGRQTIRG